jgi:hypothetical protein
MWTFLVWLNHPFPFIAGFVQMILAINLCGQTLYVVDVMLQEVRIEL